MAINPTRYILKHQLSGQQIAFDQNISKFPTHWRQGAVTIIADITSTISILASRFRVDRIRSGIHQVSKLEAFSVTCCL